MKEKIKLITKRYTLYLWISLLVLSCTKQQNFSSLFKEVRKIEHQSLSNKNDVIIGSGWFMSKAGNHLIIENRDEQNLLLLYDIADSRFVRRFAPSGQGPEEFIVLNKVQVKNDSTIFLHDPAKKQFIEYVFTIDSSKEINDRKVNVIDWGEDMPLYTIKTKGYYVVTNTVREGFFTLYDTLGHALGTFCSYPVKEEYANHENVQKAFIHQGQFIARFHSDQFVYAVDYAPIIQFFHIEDSKILPDKEHIYGYVEYTINNDGGVSSDRNSPIIFVASYATDNRLYIVYSGSAYNEKGPAAFLGNEILVFDWDGNPICRYLSDVQVRGISVSDDDKIMWAIAYNPDPELVMFKLE